MGDDQLALIPGYSVYRNEARQEIAMQMQVVEQNPFLVPAGQGRGNEVLKIGDNSVLVKLSGVETDGQLSVCEVTMSPQSGPPLHFHTREDEWFFVLEGNFTFEVDGQTIHAEPGDSLFAPRLIPHTFQNAGTKPGRMLVVAEPAGMEDYFRDLAECEADPIRYQELMERYGMSLLGPPLNARSQINGSPQSRLAGSKLV